MKIRFNAYKVWNLFQWDFCIYQQQRTLWRSTVCIEIDGHILLSSKCWLVSHNWKHFELILSCSALKASFSSSPSSLPVLLPSSVSASVSCIDESSDSCPGNISLPRTKHIQHIYPWQKRNTNTYRNTYLLLYIHTYMVHLYSFQSTGMSPFKVAAIPLRRYPAKSCLSGTFSSRIFL